MDRIGDACSQARIQLAGECNYPRCARSIKDSRWLRVGPCVGQGGAGGV